MFRIQKSNFPFTMKICVDFKELVVDEIVFSVPTRLFGFFRKSHGLRSGEYEGWVIYENPQL